jgi:hypothetical protein
MTMTRINGENGFKAAAMPGGGREGGRFANTLRWGVKIAGGHGVCRNKGVSCGRSFERKFDGCTA